MTTDTEQEHQRASTEDILLAILGLVAGPLLWWMSYSWSSQPSPSSLQTLEYWIALICGFIGVALATVWLIFLVAGAVFVVGIKTRRATLTYWSKFFTPMFLRRILISVVGLQLALSSQAVASPEQKDAQLEAPSLPSEGAFMPHVEDPIASRSDEVQDSLESEFSPPLSEDSLLLPSPNVSSSQSSQPAVSPKPRETSEHDVAPSPTSSEVHELVPTPRQTSTLTVDFDKPQDQISRQQAKKHQSGEFTPTPVPMTPHIAVPPQASASEESTLVVKAGDCLWDIAHYELGSDATLFQIDRRWRQWWEYNAAVIGDDPHTIQAGTILEIPPFTD